MGIILGVYRYERESESEFKQWCEDITDDCACSLFGAWWDRNRQEARRNAMRTFLRERCPEWTRWLNTG
jgi:hypothetical protein